MTRHINTGLGDVETVSTVFTSPTGADLTGVTPLQVAFGSYDGSTVGTWQTATSSLSADKHTVTLTVTVGVGHYNPATGTYWLWRNVGGDVSVDPSTRFEIDNDAGTDIGSGKPWATVTDNGNGTFTLAGAS